MVLSRDAQDSEKNQSVASRRVSAAMLALWVGVLTALITGPMPKLLDLLLGNPSDARVHEIVAEQTKLLTDKYNETVTVLNKVQMELMALKTDYSFIQGSVSVMKDVLQLCCKQDTVSYRHFEAPPPAAAVGGSHPAVANEPVELKKLPEFNIQQRAE